MRSKTAMWFECKIRYEKIMEDGTPKKVNEVYVIDALSFSEAEERIMEEMSSYISGEIELVDVKIAPYKEIFFADNNLTDRWFKAKVVYITIDERTQREKRMPVMVLVNAGNINSAIKNTDEVMGGTMIDYAITAIQETKIFDVVDNFRVFPFIPTSSEPL